VSPCSGEGADSDQYEDGLYEEPVPMEGLSLTVPQVPNSQRPSQIEADSGKWLFHFYLEISTPTWPPYSTDFLYLRFVGMKGARINMRSAYSQWWPTMVAHNDTHNGGQQ